MKFGQVIGLELCFLFVVGCGDGRASRPPDGGPPADGIIDAGSDAATNAPLVVELHNQFPLVDGDTANADFVAAQDGDGAWVALTGNRGIYTMPRSADRYSVLVVCHTENRWVSRISAFSVAESGLLQKLSSCAPQGRFANIRVRAQLRGIPPSRIGVVAAPADFVTRDNDGEVVFALAPGQNEVLAWISDDAGHNVSKLVRIAPFTAVMDQSLAIDFATGVDPVTLPLTVTGDTVTRISAGIATVAGDHTLESLPGAAFQTLPPTLRRPGDRQLIKLEGLHSNARIEQATFGSVTIDLPTALAPATAVLTSEAAGRRPIWTVPPLQVPRGAGRVSLSADTSREGESRSWRVSMPRSRDSLVYEWPDFPTLLPGFPTAALLQPATAITWFASSSDDFVQPDDTHVGAVVSFDGTLP